MYIKYLVNVTYIFKVAAILFVFFSLFASPPNLIRFTTLIIGTVMHLFWGYPHTMNYGSFMNFFKKSHFALFQLTCIGCSEITMIFFVRHCDLYSLIYGFFNVFKTSLFKW